MSVKILLAQSVQATGRVLRPGVLRGEVVEQGGVVLVTHPGVGILDPLPMVDAGFGPAWGDWRVDGFRHGTNDRR